MNKNKVLKITTIIVLLLFYNCSTYKYGADYLAQKSNLTFGFVKQKIQKGETSQVEILQFFGAPNLIAKNKSNAEVWSYNKMAVVSKGGVGVSKRRASVSTSSQSFDLIITFDTNDIVADYSIVSSAY